MLMNREDRRTLKAIFGHRARFDEAERRLYASDLWQPPHPLVQLIKNLPEAVVLPQRESELVELMEFANALQIPLVPRGGGTALNGGAMPVQNGIVVDLSHMDKRFDATPEGDEVTVGAGMTFETLAARLASFGQAPAVEPVYPEATTVGGWFATGGIGFGSNRYGPIEQGVSSIRVVLPDGSRRVFSSKELDVFAKAHGSTGIITAVTLRTRPLEPMHPFLASFSDLASLHEAMSSLRGATRWWTLTMESPETVALKAESLGERPPARNAFLLLGAASESDWNQTDPETLKRLVEEHDGKVVDAKKTAMWWSHHKQVYRAKSHGPSIVPVSLVVATREYGRAVAKVHKAVHAAHWSMTAIVAGDETLLIGYALDDERRPTYRFSYGATAAAMKAVRSLGGRPASLGVAFAGEAGRVLGESQSQRVQEFNAAVDRKGIMNPGKVFGTPIRFKPANAPGPSLQDALKPRDAMLRQVHGSTFVRYQRREDARAPYKAGLSAALGASGAGAFGAKWSWDVVASDQDAALRHASASARAFRHLGAGPLGWLHWIKRYLYERGPVTEYQYLALCGEGIAAEAELKSRFGLHYSDMLMELKEQLNEQGFRPMSAHRRIAAHIEKTHNRYGRPNEERTGWAGDLELAEKGTMLLFVDDAVSFEAPAFANKAVRLLQGAGETPAYLGQEEWSSGEVLFSTGQSEAAKPLVEHNVKAVKKAGAKTVVTFDPWAHHVLSRIYPRVAKELGLEWDVKVEHVYEVLARHKKAEKIAAPQARMEAVLHHPPVFTLHGVDDGSTREALTLFGLEVSFLPHHGKEAMDVAASGAVPQALPQIPERAAAYVLADAAHVGASWIVSSDPSSGMILKNAQGADKTEADDWPQVHLIGDPLPETKEKDDEGQAGGEGEEKDDEGETKSPEKSGKDDEKADGDKKEAASKAV